MKCAFKCALAFALASLAGCAESMDGYRTDLGTETKDDSSDDGQTGKDTSTVDGSTDDATGTVDDPSTNPGGEDTLACPSDDDPCCQDGRILPDTAICDPQADVQYSCQGDSACGSAIYARYKTRYCSGANWVCTGEKGAWGEWEEHQACESAQRCQELAEPEEEGGGVGRESEIACVPDVESCPVDFAQTVCFNDGWVMDDWPTEDEVPAVLPSMTVSADLSGLGVGEVVEMELYVTNRNALATSFGAVTFFDIEATITHDGITVPFYNGYDSNLIFPLENGYSFQKNWVLPHFWGSDMAGRWTLKFTDRAYSAPFRKFKLNKWCLRFRDPDVSEKKTTMEAKRLLAGIKRDLTFGTTKVELQSDDIVQVGTQNPKLCLALAHADPTDVAVSLVAANGSVYEVKLKDSEVIPEEVELLGLEGEWLTGRYQLAITSESYAMENQILGFSINYGVACNLPDVPQPDTDPDSESDTGSDSEPDTGSDSESQSDTGSESEQDTGSQSDSGSQSEQDTDSQLDSGSQSEQDTDSQSDSGL